jgi:hypothetical protein
VISILQKKEIIAVAEKGKQQLFRVDCARAGISGAASW